MTMDLRPLSLAELLDRAFTLYRRNLWLFVGIMAVPSSVALVLNLLSEGFNRSLVASRTGPAVPPENPEQLVLLSLGFIGVALVAAVAYFVVYAVALGAITLAVSEIYQGRTTQIGGVFRQLRPRFGTLVWLMFQIMVRVAIIGFLGIVFVAGAAGVVSALGGPVLMALVMVPGFLAVAGLTLWMVLRWGVAVPVAVLEGIGASAAISRSEHLTRGRLFRVLVLVVFASVITYAALMALQGPFLAMAIWAGPESWASFWFTVAGVFAGTIGATFTGPIMIVALALLYYDARIRDEGLDLELMMASLDGRAFPLARG